MTAGERDFVAYHEAGHAVIAMLQHLPVDRVTIDPNGEALGHAEHDTFYMTEEEGDNSGIVEWEQIRAEANARVALAGEIAQRMHDQNSVDPEHAASDRAKFSDCLLRLSADESEREAYAHLLRLQTENKLRTNWGAVERVAELLLIHTTIDAKALRLATWPALSTIAALD